MKLEKYELEAILEKLKGDKSDIDAMQDLIDAYFGLLKRLKETPLYDVLVYEDNLTKTTTAFSKIMVEENCELKKEVNKLRKQLNKIEKYRV